MTDLKLLALDTEDLEVISAHVQDAVVRVADMGYARGDRRFALLMNRFDWESGQGRRDKGVRKRVRVTKSGKVKFRHPFTSHLMSGKSGNRRRRMRRRATAATADTKRMLEMLGKGAV